MAQDPARNGLFVNYRRADTGWAANAVADALRRKLGPSVDVFLDNRSIGLGESFARVLEEGVRGSAVLVVLIGPRWDEPPLVDCLAESDDWVRREISSLESAVRGSFPCSSTEQRRRLRTGSPLS